MSGVHYDCVIVGGGPAGLTAGLYAARARLNVVLFEKSAPGGQIMVSDLVENYPGFPEGISGAELSMKFAEQAEKQGLVIENREILSVDFSGDPKKIVTDGGEVTADTVILASGAEPRKLGVPGENALYGRGVSFCATCDGPFFRGKTVAAVGGGDTAVQESMFLTRFAEKVYLIHRRDQLRAAKVLQERALKNERIEMVWNSVLTEIQGQDGVTGVRVKNKLTGEENDLAVDGCFVWVGIVPNTDFLKGAVELDKNGFIVTDGRTRTSVSGVFAAGDATDTPLRQVSTGVGDGATAAVLAQHYLEEKES